MSILHRHHGTRSCGKCLHAGSCAVVCSINHNHPSARRLMAMGFDDGCEIKVECVAPLGDPYMVSVRGYSLALRRRDLEALDLKELEQAEV